ncbi:MAG: hypothetical protein ABIP53_09530 [Candidatus Limnocylindrales bacterium]
MLISMVLAGLRITDAELRPGDVPARPGPYGQRRDQLVEQLLCRAVCALGDFLDGYAGRGGVEVAYRELAALLDSDLVLDRT